MSPITILVISLTACLATSTRADSVTDGTELVFAFMVHRHGDRAPATSSMLTYVGDSINMTLAEEMVDQIGYGQLTKVGKNTGYKLGQFIRRRYDELIAPYFNSSELYLRSTNYYRVQMTLLTALSALFPALEDNWSDSINWTPVPYTTLPTVYDFNEPAESCTNYISLLDSSMLTFGSNARFEIYTELLEQVTELTGTDAVSSPALFAAIFDTYVCLKSMGYPLSDEIMALMPAMREANDVYWDLVYGDNLALAAGPMLYEFFEYANKTIAGEDTPSVRIYAAHDTNVYPIVAITQVEERQGAPKFAALYSLELRKVTSTGKYAVLPVYLDDPKIGVEKYLQIEGCSGEYLCDYDEFLSITSANAIDEDSWWTKCESS